MALLAFLQAWDLLRDELGREPRLDEYAERFAVSDGAARDALERFEYAFPGRSPGQILDLLWRWHDSRLKALSRLPIARG